jgi:hypothetical protein
MLDDDIYENCDLGSIRFLLWGVRPIHQGVDASHLDSWHQLVVARRRDWVRGHDRQPFRVFPKELVSLCGGVWYGELVRHHPVLKRGMHWTMVELWSNGYD